MTRVIDQYRGAVLTDVIGGRVPIVISNTGAILPTVREGKLRGLAITALERSPNVPELPTIAESGFPGFEATSWFALLAPKGTPKPIVEKAEVKGTKLTRVRADGTFASGMPGGPTTPQPNSALLGVIIESPNGDVFVKMTGPGDVVKANAQNFEDLIKSALE